MNTRPEAPPPLDGLRIVEIGHFIAAPFATRILGDLGAEIIKIEPPDGDPVRGWGAQSNGASLWWSVHGRNKRSVAVDLKSPEGVEAVGRIIARSDALIENQRPGGLARLGFDRERLQELRPGLVVAHISGYGQTGPLRDRAAFGVIGEAIGGLRHLTDHPPGTTNLPPPRVGISVGDSVAGLYAVIGVLAGLLRRDRRTDIRGDEDADISTVDVALTEAVLSLMEGIVTEYGALGLVRQPVGARIASAAPTSAYPSADGRWVIVAANSDLLFQRLTALIGREDLANRPELRSNAGRLEHVDELDEAISAWSRQYDAGRLAELLAKADIPSTLIYTAAEIADDPQFRARGMVRDVNDPRHGNLLHPGIVPHFPASPGAIRCTGPDVGQDTEAVLAEIAGYSTDEIKALYQKGVIA
ncbi:carnitine dehydratase [Rhodovulum sp. NI22]|nr:carnitine dehydratase [Rhodovulum sp. NI22]